MTPMTIILPDDAWDAISKEAEAKRTSLSVILYTAWLRASREAA